MAEHVLGEPYRYKHGWIKVGETEDYKEFSAPISELKKYRGHGQYRSSKDVNQLADDIAKNGVKHPITFSEQIGMADGHHRLQASEQAGLTHVPVRVYKSHKAENAATDADTKRTATFYKSEIKANAEEAEYQKMLDSPEYKAKVAARKTAAKKKQKDWLVDAAARLRKEGKASMAAQAQAEADAISLSRRQLGSLRFIELAKSKVAAHIVSAPPMDQTLVQEIAHILEYSYKSKPKTLTHQVAGLTALLPDIEQNVILTALGLANKGTRARPNARLREAGLNSAADSVREVANNDLYYRAAYVMNAAKRIQANIDSGTPMRKAVAKESLFFKQHEAARRNRLVAAAQVQKSSNFFGTLLGWYLNPLLNNEAECIAANGHNFYADEGTVIGLPGSVHAGCGCKSGPPHAGAGLVNDALKNVVKIGVARKYRVKRAQ